MKLLKRLFGKKKPPVDKGDKLFCMAKDRGMVMCSPQCINCKLIQKAHNP